MPNGKWNAPINITKEQWANLLKDEKIITKQDLRLLKAIYGCNGCKATSVELARLLGLSETGRPVNLQVGKLGQRIIDKLNIAAEWPEEYKKFNVPFTGESRKGKIYWILRQELQDAIQEIDEKTVLTEIIFPEEIEPDRLENLYEGARKQVYVNTYERNRSARDQCIKRYGTQCFICQFDFAKKYGEVGKGVIHVHHLKPLSDIGEKYRVDPINDLRPICPNCHVMVHSKNPPYSINEIKMMINNTKT